MMSVLRYRIDKIVTTGFEVVQPKKLDNLQFSVSFQFKVSVDDKVICCISHYEFKSKEAIVMRLELECYFQIESKYFDSLMKNQEVLSIDTDTLQYLATIAVGTARGEIHARCEMVDSPLQEIVLPPIDLTKIITTPAEFPL